MDVAEAGEKAPVTIYNGKSTNTMNTLQYQQYWDKMALSSSHIQPQTLPPTSEAAKYPSLHVYLQFKNGRAVQMNFSRQIGAGRSVMKALFHYGQRYLQHLKICYVSSGVTASRNVKPRALVRSTTFTAL